MLLKYDGQNNTWQYPWILSPGALKPEKKSARRKKPTSVNKSKKILVVKKTARTKNKTKKSNKATSFQSTVPVKSVKKISRISNDENSKVLRFVAPDVEAAMNKVILSLGEDAYIHETVRTANGVEIHASMEKLQGDKGEYDCLLLHLQQIQQELAEIRGRLGQVSHIVNPTNDSPVKIDIGNPSASINSNNLRDSCSIEMISKQKNSLWKLPKRTWVLIGILVISLIAQYFI